MLRPGIVHRIDMDTTGVLVVCKNDAAHQSLAEQLKVHSITRKYYAVVFGGLSKEEGTIRAPIGRHPTDRKKMSVNAKNGRDAVTHYRVHFPRLPFPSLPFPSLPFPDRKSTRLNSSHTSKSRMPSSA